MKNQTIKIPLNDFSQMTLSFEKNLFSSLFNEIEFEQIGKGRLGNQLVKVSTSGISLVRTTTQYSIPSYKFSTLHEQIIESVNNKLEATSPLHFNNALIEVYDANYKKMKYHSDQALDLASDSYIGLFSCYENPSEISEKNVRKLKIKNKETEEEFEILLTHNSFVFFSLESNAKYSHKIVLEGVHAHEQKADNRWLGITFRESSTFIKFKDSLPYLPNGKLLTLATEEEQKEYYKLRGQENSSLNFKYPKLDYTLSRADLMLPHQTNNN